jgi:hypothetical protein
MHDALAVAYRLASPYLSGEILAAKGTGRMTTFDDRERAFETKYARDEEMAFRVIARRNRLLGHWAAGLMKLTKEEADAYASSVVQAEFEEAGDEDVIRKLVSDLSAASIDVDEGAVRRAIEEQTIEARRQLMQQE